MLFEIFIKRLSKYENDIFNTRYFLIEFFMMEEVLSVEKTTKYNTPKHKCSQKHLYSWINFLVCRGLYIYIWHLNLINHGFLLYIFLNIAKI